MVSPLSSDWWTPVKVMAAVFGGALVLDSIIAVWGERSPVGGFCEELIARGGHYVVVIGALAGGLFFGAKVSQKTRSSFVGWISGFFCFIVIGGAGMLLLSAIPGVGWRYERVQESLEGDY